jgi:outer membrane receptor protein involved in Fe transport
LAALALALPGAFPATAIAQEIVQLPGLTVNERQSRTNRPSVVPFESGAAADASLADLARETPGLAFNDAGARGFGTTTTLRGLGNTPFFSDASAPIYLDDIPLATAFTFPTELYDFGQMTLYRGPQAAALFGRAGDAGVIQFTSPAPGATDVSQFGFTAGNHHQGSLRATAQAAHSDQWDASVNLGASQREGYLYNTVLRQTVDDREAIFGRIRVAYRPVKDLEVSLHVLTQRSRDGAQPLVPLGGPYYEVSRSQEGVADTTFTACALGITRQFAAGALTSTTSYTDWELSPYSNRLVVFGGFDFDSVLTQSQRTLNEELRYVSGKFTAGAFFSHARTRGAASRTFSGFPIEDSNFQLRSDAFALFGQANFTPSADWLITPGLRLEQADKDFVRNEIVPTHAVLNRSNRWSALLPSLSVVRHLDRGTDLSFTVARGFKAGGYSAYTGVASLAGYDPQRTWGLEGALTTAGAESKWAFTSRAYAYRVTGYQIERSFAVPSTSTDEYLVANAQRAQILGLELESAWHPVANLTLRAMAGLTDATLKDFTDPFTGVSYSGKRAPYVPSGNGALRLEYRPARGFFGGAGVTWTGRTFYDEQETSALSQPAYALLDAHAGYAFARGSVRLFGRNLTGEEYYSSITPGVYHGTPGPPLNWGGEVSVRW